MQARRKGRRSPGFQRFVFILLGVVLLTSRARCDEYHSEPLGVTFPAELGGLRLVKVTDYEKQGAGLGTGITYTRRAIKADIYIYTAGLKSLPDDSEAAVVGDHFKAAAGDVLEMNRRGLYQDVKFVVLRETQFLGSRAILHGQFTFTSDGEPRISHLYLCVIKGHFFKIRFTYPASDELDGTASLKGFLDDLAKLLPPPDDRR